MRPLIFALLFLSVTPALSCDRVALFGHWADIDGDGRNARDQMLDAGDQGGFWIGRYDGIVIRDPGKVDIDHVVPLCLAAEWGAADWPRELRVQFANDPMNLAVTGQSANRSKGSRPPSDWMPRNTAEWGPILAQFNAVLDKYPLTIPPEERAALDCYARFVRLTGKGFRPGRWNCP